MPKIIDALTAKEGDSLLRKAYRVRDRFEAASRSAAYVVLRGSTLVAQVHVLFPPRGHAERPTRLLARVWGKWAQRFAQGDDGVALIGSEAGGYGYDKEAACWHGAELWRLAPRCRWDAARGDFHSSCWRRRLEDEGYAVHEATMA